MGSTKSGARAVPPNVELTQEFRYMNYRETVARMLANGICSKETAEAMLNRVEILVGEDSG